MASSERFGYEWDRYESLDDNYEAQFLNWIGPLSKDSYKDKKVLDVGCGMGRNSYWPLMYGAEHVTAFDFDRRTVAAAEKTLEDFKNKTILYKSVYDITWENEFDIASSIGVIHHLDKPKEAIRNMVRALKPGGTFHMWVYSYDGNEWIVKFVNPVRIHITSKLPVPLVHFLTYFCSIPLYLFVRVYRGKNGYLNQLKGFKFWHVHSIAFDQLIPRVANYWKKEELEELMQDIGATDVVIEPPKNECGWVVTARKAQA